MERLFHAWLAVSSFFVRTDDEEGATAVEYGLIVALIAVFLIAALTAMGGSLAAIFGRISQELDAVVNN